jgi:hypothetical protein
MWTKGAPRFCRGAFRFAGSPCPRWATIRQPALWKAKYAAKRATVASRLHPTEKYNLEECQSVTTRGIMPKNGGNFFKSVRGREMHRLVIVAAGLLSIAGVVSAASAADLPPRIYTKAPPMVAPAYDWTGFYIGFDGGGASSHECLTITSVAGAAVPQKSEGCHDATGGLVGGQLGYRWQLTNWVLGVEAQGDGANLQGSNSSLTAIFPTRTRPRSTPSGFSPVRSAMPGITCSST